MLIISVVLLSPARRQNRWSSCASNNLKPVGISPAKSRTLPHPILRNIPNNCCSSLSFESKINHIFLCCFDQFVRSPKMPLVWGWKMGIWEDNTVGTWTSNTMNWFLWMERPKSAWNIWGIWRCYIIPVMLQ